MVDAWSIISIVLIIVIGLPTALLVTGRILGFFNSFTATGARTEKPTSEVKGKALIVYEPGATSQTKKAGEEIGDLLLERGYEVTLAGLRSNAAKDTAGYDLLLVGTPTYVGRAPYPVKKYARKLRLNGNQTFGMYLIGTKGAPSVGLVPKAFLDSMKKPFAESGVQAREMAFSGYSPFDFAEFVARLVDPTKAVISPEITAS